MMRSKGFTKRGANFRSRFRRSNLRRPVMTAKWEVGRFYFDNTRTMVTGSASETLQYFHIASIATSFGSAIGVEEARVGAVLAGLNRSLEIGGIVFDVDHLHRGDVQGDLAPGEATYDMHLSLVVDNLDRVVPDGPSFPTSLDTYSPWLSSFPTAALTTAAPVDRSEPITRPVRTYWERNVPIDLRPKIVLNDLGDTLYVPQNQRLNSTHYLVNRRLKLRLDENQGLFLIEGTRNSANFNLGVSSRIITTKCVGKLYYRYRQ